MREALVVGIASFWFLFGSLISGWIDGNTYIAQTQLTSAATANSTTLNVISTQGFPTAPNYLLVDDEIVVYTGTTPTSFTGLTRGQIHPNLNVATTASTHVVRAKVLTVPASAIDSVVGFNANALSVAYGSFGIVEFSSGVFSFFKNLPRLVGFDYSFLKGPYNALTGTNDPSDIMYVRWSLILLFEAPFIIGLILMLRRILFA